MTNMISRGFLSAFILLAAARAAANSDSVLALGAGVACGATRDVTDSATANGFSADVNIVLRFPWFLAAEIAYSPTDRVTHGEQTVLDSRFRVSGRFYLVPTYPVGFYLKGGVGAATPAALFPIDGAGNSYHAGAGLDIHTGDHVVTTLEVLGDVPNAGAWNQDALGQGGFNPIAMVRHLRVRGAVGIRYFF